MLCCKPVALAARECGPGPALNGARLASCSPVLARGYVRGAGTHESRRLQQEEGKRRRLLPPLLQVPRCPTTGERQGPATSACQLQPGGLRGLHRPVIWAFQGRACACVPHAAAELHFETASGRVLTTLEPVGGWYHEKRFLILMAESEHPLVGKRALLAAPHPRCCVGKACPTWHHTTLPMPAPHSHRHASCLH